VDILQNVYHTYTFIRRHPARLDCSYWPPTIFILQPAGAALPRATTTRTFRLTHSHKNIRASPLLLPQTATLLAPTSTDQLYVDSHAPLQTVILLLTSINKVPLSREIDEPIWLAN
jgi:hypothetical protein